MMEIFGSTVTICKIHMCSAMLQINKPSAIKLTWMCQMVLTFFWPDKWWHFKIVAGFILTIKTKFFIFSHFCNLNNGDKVLMWFISVWRILGTFKLLHNIFSIKNIFVSFRKLFYKLIDFVIDSCLRDNL